MALDLAHKATEGFMPFCKLPRPVFELGTDGRVWTGESHLLGAEGAGGKSPCWTAFSTAGCQENKQKHKTWTHHTKAVRQ